MEMCFQSYHRKTVPEVCTYHKSGPNPIPTGREKLIGDIMTSSTMMVPRSAKTVSPSYFES